MRRAGRGILLLAAVGLLLAGCEEGERVDLPGGGAGSQVVTLVQVTPDPISRTAPIQFEATVTVDGTPEPNVVVTFSTGNPPLSPEVFAPPTQTTAPLTGRALTTLSTFLGTPLFSPTPSI